MSNSQMSFMEKFDDPFELLLIFQDMLKRITAAKDSCSRPLRFMQRWRQHSDVLYTALLTQIQDITSANQRMNMFYFIDMVCTSESKSSASEYISVFAKDIEKIITEICFAQDSYIVNACSVRKVLKQWRDSGILKEHQYNFACTRLDELNQKSGTSNSGDDNTAAPCWKYDATKRMEEDRERQKLSREEGWLRPSSQAIEEQFEEDWNQLNPLDMATIENFVQQEETSYLFCYSGETRDIFNSPSSPTTEKSSSRNATAGAKLSTENGVLYEGVKNGSASSTKNRISCSANMVSNKGVTEKHRYHHRHGEKYRHDIKK